MLSITQIEILKNIKDQASYFLKHAGEFFPFATVVDKDHQLKPLSVYFGVEHPTSQAVFEQLETGILKGINAGNYISAAIGLDVIMKNENHKELTTLKIILFEKDKKYSFFYNYFLKEDKYIFQEIT